MTAHSTLAFTAWLLLQFFNSPQVLYLPSPYEDEYNDNEMLLAMVEEAIQLPHDPHSSMRDALHNFQLYTFYNLFDDDLEFGVKPHSTT